MSFLNVLGKVLHGGEIVALVSAPAIGAVNPLAGALTQMLATSIIRAEQIYADKPKSGDVKKQFVQDETANGLTAVNAVLASIGRKPVDVAAVHNTIDPLVAALNAVAQLTAQSSQ